MINFKKITAFYKKNKMLMNLGGVFIVLFTFMEIWRACFQGLITFFDDLGIFIAFGTFLFTFINWLNMERQNEEIKIKLLLIENESTKDEYILPFTIMRKHFTRSELQGVLGLAYSDGKYDSTHLSISSSNDYKNILRIQDGEKDVIQIKVYEKATYDKFKVSSEK